MTPVYTSMQRLPDRVLINRDCSLETNGNADCYEQLVLEKAYSTQRLMLTGTQ